MLKNRIKKFIVIALCAVFALPFFTIVNKISPTYAANYDYTETIFVSSYHNYEIKNTGINSAGIGDIVITAKKSGGESLVVFENGKKTNTDTNNRWCEASITKTDGANKVSLIIRVLGDVEIVVQVEETSNKHTSLFTVVDDESCLEVDYFYDSTKINDYNNLIEENVKDKSYGDYFIVPSLESILDTSVDYNRITKNVYYVSPGSTSYSTVSGTKTNPSFSLSTAGTYRFYSELYVEKPTYDGNAFTLTKKYLVEKIDGFYAVYKKGTDTKLYAFSENDGYVYYEDEDKEVLYEGEIEYSVNPIIPIFTFNLEYKLPTIEIVSTYDKEGFIGLQHSVDYVRVKGSDVKATYTLLYSADDGLTWVEAEEELDVSLLTFTPEKKGKYKVKVEVVDVMGNTDSADTAVIVVSQKYFVVDHVTSFSDWLSVNTMPFILLCISATCLLGIIALLVIKPKDKTIDKVEEDR